MAIINVDGVPVENSTTPAVDGTNAVNNIQSFGQLEGGFINALREDDTLTVNTFDADSSGFEVNGNEGDDTVIIDNNVESTDRATGAVSSFTAFAGKGDDSIGIQDLIVDAGSQVFGNIGEDSIFVETDNAVDGLLINGNQDDDSIEIEGRNGDLPDFDNSQVFGGQGNDTFNIDDVRNIDNVLFSGDLGSDSIFIDSDTLSDSNVFGGDGRDTLNIEISNDSNSADNVINGNAGNDSIFIDGDGWINSQFYGGKDNDTIDLDSADLEGGLVEGNLGNDSILLGDLDGVAVNGNAGNDTIVLETIVGSSIWGGQGDDTIGSDTFEDFTDSVIAGDKGDDTIKFGESNALINTSVLGGEDDDSIILGDLNIVASSLPDSTFRNAASADSDSVIDGGAGDDVIAFEGSEVEDATILGGAGADTFQLWNGGTVELTDFEAGTDSLILGDYINTTVSDSTTALVSSLSFFTGVTVSLTVGTTTLEAGDKLGASNVNSPLFTGASFAGARADIFKLATNAGTTGALSTPVQVLFLDNEGSDAGLYLYSLDGDNIRYNTGTAKAEFVSVVTTNTNVIALGTFAPSDIQVI